jgi:flagellar hook assembly protein FlgD
MRVRLSSSVVTLAILCTVTFGLAARAAAASRPLTVNPTISASPTLFSPNGDGRNDTTTMKIGLPSKEHVTLTITRVAGHLLERTVDLGLLAAGSHEFLWRGKDAASQTVPDGSYTVAIEVEETGGSTETGSAQTTVVVDTTPPTLTTLVGSGGSIFPYPDGYLDTFTPRVTIGGPVALTLTITKGTYVVRSITTPQVSAGSRGITWDGKNGSGGTVPSGAYSFFFRAEDAAGNRHDTASHPVTVDGRRLVAKSSLLQLNGRQSQISGTNTTGCMGFSYSESHFSQGVLLVNVCPNPPAELVAAFYTFTVPAATVYSSMQLRSYGNTDGAPERIVAAVENGDTTFSSLKVVQLFTNNHNGWADYGPFSAAGGRVTSGRHVVVGVGVPNADGPEDYDIGVVQLTVSYKILQ